MTYKMRQDAETEMPRRRWYGNTSTLALSCRDHSRDPFERDVHRSPCSGEEQDVLLKFRPMHRSQQKQSNHTEHCSPLLTNMVLSSDSSGPEYKGTRRCVDLEAAQGPACHGHNEYRHMTATRKTAIETTSGRFCACPSCRVRCPRQRKF